MSTDEDTCAWCGAAGCHWTRHAAAVDEARVWRARPALLGVYGTAELRHEALHLDEAQRPP